MSALLNLCSLGGVIYVAAVIQLSLLIDQFCSIFFNLFYSVSFILLCLHFDYHTLPYFHFYHLFFIWVLCVISAMSFHSYWIWNILTFLKVRKFQNENMESSHCPKYERKIWKILPWILRAEFFKIFRSYCGQFDDFRFSFWNLLTFRNSSFRSEQYSLSSQLLNHLLTKGKVLKVSKNLINASFSPHIFSLLQIWSYFYNTITKINNSQAIFKMANPVTLNFFFQYILIILWNLIPSKNIMFL